MKQEPRVSIIMPAYNVREFVEETIETIAAQTFSSFEVIVIDDGSTDNTDEVLAAARASWPRGTTDFKIITQTNAGAAAARNTGAAGARGELLAFMDADDRWQPETLALLVATLDAHRDSDITCPRYRRINEKGLAVNYLGEETRADLSSLKSHKTFTAGETLLATPAQSATGVLVRKDAFDAGGGFDAALKSNNDIDCWLRILWMRNSTLVQCPQAVVDYRIRSAQITSDVGRMREGHRFFLRNHQPLLREIGWVGRMKHAGLVRAYWSVIAARQCDLKNAFALWASAIAFYPRLALPGTLGSSAAFSITKAAMPVKMWNRISLLRKRLKSQR